MVRRKIKSINSYRKELKSLEDFILGTYAIIRLYKELPQIQYLKEHNTNLKKFIGKHKDQMKFNQDRIDKLYELGFISLFATFESFMYEFLREQYTLYPDSIPYDKKIHVGDILDWKTQKSVRDFIIDHVAIENSYDLQKWEHTLKESFGIEIFNNEKQKEQFIMLNIFRNSLAHSGGRFNSKIINEAKKLFPNEFKNTKKSLFEVSRMDVFDERLFNHLIVATKDIVNNIENKILNKK